MSARSESLLARVSQLQDVQIACLAEAKMLHKIAADLVAKANKLEETAAYHDRQIAQWQGMIRDEAEREEERRRMIVQDYISEGLGE
jgi:hypothetical protein